MSERPKYLSRTVLPEYGNVTKFPFKLGDRTQSDAWNDAQGYARFPSGRTLQLARSVTRPDGGLPEGMMTGYMDVSYPISAKAVGDFMYAQDYNDFVDAITHPTMGHRHDGVDQATGGTGRKVRASDLDALAANVDLGDFQIRLKQLYCDVPTGIAPLVIESTTKVANLNAEQVDGVDLPASIASVLTDHTKAVHDALAINAAQTDGLDLPNTIANLLTDHNLAAHPLSIIPTMDDAHIPTHDLVTKHSKTGLTAGQFFRALTASTFGFEAIKFSAGGTVLTPTEAINIIVWYAEFPCTVTNVRGYRVGGSGATINARRNGAYNHLASALSLTSADTWMDGGAVQNTAYAIGDKLEIMVVSVAGSPTQVAIQVAFTRP